MTIGDGVARSAASGRPEGSPATAIKLALGLTVALSGMDLLGWVLQVPFLTSPGEHWTAMQVATALCFLLGAAALACAVGRPPSRGRLFLSRVFGVAVGLTGLLSLTAWLIRLDTGREWAWTSAPVLHLFLASNLRMAAITAILFTLFGVVLLLLSAARPRTDHVAHAALLPAAVMTYQVLVGYLLDVPVFHTWMHLGIALNSGLAFAALCTAAFLARPETWLIRVFTGEAAGAVMARRLLPALLLLPLCIGWLRLYGERTGRFGSETGVALVVVTYTACFLGLVWLAARSVNRTDRERRRSEERVRTTMDNMLEGCQILDRDWRYLYINDAAERHNRRPRGELLGKRYMDMWPGIESTHVFAVIRACLEEGRARSFENEFSFPDGALGWFDLSIQPVPEGVFILSVDVTDRRRAEESRRESEARLNRSQELAHLGGWELDLVRNRLYWSDEVYRIFGLEPQQFMATYEAFIEAVHPDDREAVNAAYSTSIREGRDSYEIEHRVVRKSTGEVRIVLEKCDHLRDASGRIIRSVGMVHDITERKQAEAELHRTLQYLNNLVDYANAPIICWDTQFRITRFNRAFERLTRHQASEVLGRDLEMLFPSATREDSLAKIRDTLAGVPMEVVEIPILRRDGEVRIVLWNSANICAEDGTTTRETIAQGQDITERKRVEGELKRSNENLEQFAYVASHDLQEPLRMMASYSQLLERRYKDQLDSDAGEFIGYIVDGAERMQRLINDLLAYSRVGRADAPLAPTDCGVVMDRVLAGLRPAIEESGARVIRNALPVVEGNESRLIQLFQNLIGNAIKFQRPGVTPEIHVGARRIARGEAVSGFKFQVSGSPAHKSDNLNEAVPGSRFKVQGSTAPKPETQDEAVPSSPAPQLETLNLKPDTDGGGWLFWVTDNGIGIEPQYRERIFLIFQRLHGRAEYPGTGIGLAICRKIVESWGGRIWVESEPGNGSAFYFTIPVKGDPHDER